MMEGRRGGCAQWKEEDYAISGINQGSRRRENVMWWSLWMQQEGQTLRRPEEITHCPCNYAALCLCRGTGLPSPEWWWPSDPFSLPHSLRALLCKELQTRSRRQKTQLLQSNFFLYRKKRCRSNEFWVTDSLLPCFFLIRTIPYWGELSIFHSGFFSLWTFFPR